MLQSASMPNIFWAEAIATAVYISNMTPTHVLGSQSPFEIWTGRPADLSHLHIPFCQVYTLVMTGRQKLDSKSKQCIYLGPALHDHAYRLYDPSTKKLIISRNVQFDETKLGFPPPTVDNTVYYDNSSDDESEPTTMNDSSDEEITAELDAANIQEGENHDEEATQELMPIFHDFTIDPRITPLQQDDPLLQEVDPLLNIPSQPADSQITTLQPTCQQTQETRKSSQNKKPSIRRLKSLECNLAQVYSSEPQSYTAAINSDNAPQWKNAMMDEYNSLIKNNTWELTPLPPGRKAIGTRWVFRIKQNANGSIERYKARWVAKGFSQHAGVDYNKTFAPVAKFPSIRVLLAVATQLNLELHQMDVDTAFLYGVIKEDIYITQLEGFIDTVHPNWVCHMKQALYGLKQAPHVWNETLDQYLLSNGFNKSMAYPCIYT